MITLLRRHTLHDLFITVLAMCVAWIPTSIHDTTRNMSSESWKMYTTGLYSIYSYMSLLTATPLSRSRRRKANKWSSPSHYWIPGFTIKSTALQRSYMGVIVIVSPNIDSVCSIFFLFVTSIGVGWWVSLCNHMPIDPYVTENKNSISQISLQI